MPKDQFGRPAPGPAPSPAPTAGFALPTGSAFPGQGVANGLVKAPGVTPITPPPQNYAKPEIPYTGQPQPSMPFVPPSGSGVDASAGFAPPSQPIFGNLPPGSRFNDAMKTLPQAPGGLFGPSQGK